MRACRAPQAWAPRTRKGVPFPIERINDREGSCAFLLGVIFNQGQRSDKAWAAPLALRERLGTLDPTEIARLAPWVIEEGLRRSPALHRFPTRMAAHVRAACRRLAECHEGDARKLWSPPRSASDLLEIFECFEGIGPHKARIAVFLLTVEFGVPVLDDGSVVSIAACPGLCDHYFPLDRAILTEAQKQ